MNLSWNWPNQERQELGLNFAPIFRYNSTATAKDFEIYAPNATFEDPLMRAHGYVVGASNDRWWGFCILDLW